MNPITQNGDVIRWRMAVYSNDRELAEKVNELKAEQNLTNMKALKHALRERIQMEGNQ